ncbi:MAG: helix-turn-helix domain-containing protein [Actinomycetota bacterium]|jgi:predicted ArsR family transcriptional regulator|nr:helix-turn-helix domain-containing protein [Actinomycetota bacterium]
MPSPVTASASLVGLLGVSRAAIVDHLHRSGAQPVAALAVHLGISEVATRRHLGVLAEDGLVEEREPRASGGRPAACFALTDRAARLFPQSYDRFANELLDFLTAEHGRDGLLAFLRWRVDREVGALTDAVQGGTLEERVVRLAEALTSAGFVADVVRDDTPNALPTLQLIQHHCVIEGVAREHPEICSYEAAAFSRALGTDVQLSRRETIADGSPACVCTVTAAVG